jgi:4-hydroxybenzoate polyprenyltransferase
MITFPLYFTLVPDLGFLLKVSRPRFWFYVFGPYIVGLAAGADRPGSLIQWQAVLFSLYFLFPANLLIYGINDIFDHDTDAVNKKKSGYELLVGRERHRLLFMWICLLNLPFVATSYALFPIAWLPMTCFLFFSIFYSAPPIRAKAIPFLDSIFNILYIFPAVFGYQMLSGSLPPVTIIMAAGLWTAAMHAYSAIPDIEADRTAGLSTIATVCGPFGTLTICLLLYAAAAVLSFPYLGFVSIALGSIYLLLMLASFPSVRHDRLFYLYRWFPLINVLSGFVLFWAVALARYT